MTVRFRCPKCYKNLRAHDKHIGRRVRCNMCGEHFSVPAGSTLTGTLQQPGLQQVGSSVDAVDRLDPAAPVHPPDNPLTRSQAAFRADLPELLEQHRGEWVAYADGQRVRFGKTQADLYRYCLNELRLSHNRFVVRRVAPELDPQIEYSVR